MEYDFWLFVSMAIGAACFGAWQNSIFAGVFLLCALDFAVRLAWRMMK